MRITHDTRVISIMKVHLFTLTSIAFEIWYGELHMSFPFDYAILRSPTEGNDKIIFEPEICDNELK